MTRIPPSITNVFKRITHSKRPADRNPTTMAAQPAPQQKTVRFAEENQVIPSHNALGHHDNRLVHGAPLAPSRRELHQRARTPPNPGPCHKQQRTKRRSMASRYWRPGQDPPDLREHPMPPRRSTRSSPQFRTNSRDLWQNWRKSRTIHHRVPRGTTLSFSGFQDLSTKRTEWKLRRLFQVLLSMIFSPHMKKKTTSQPL